MPSPREHPYVRAIVVGVFSLLVACTDGTAPDRPVVEVFGPVVGTAGSLLGTTLREISADAPVELRYVGVTSFNEQLADRLASGERPEIVLLPQPGVLTDLDERGLLQPLSDDVVAMSTADVSSGLTDLVTIDDRPTAVWINVDVKSLVWYRPAIFDERGLSIPSSLDELGSLTSANRVSADGVAPWCVTMGAGAATGWVGTDWVENFVLRRFGPEVYDRWTTGQIRFDDERIVAVFDELDALLRRPGAIAGGARAVLNTPWEREAEGVLSTPPTCLMAAQADFLRREFPTDTVIGQDGDIDFFVLPPVTAGDADPLVVGGTVAAPLVLGPDVDAAMTLLSGVDLAERLDRTGVFLSPHLRVDRAALVSPASVRLFELLEAAPVVRFDGSDLMPGAVGTGSFWAGMRAFSGGESIGTVIDTIQAGWSTTPEGGSG